MKNKMKKYKKPDWAVKQIKRETGLIEDICKCGVGHPNLEFLKSHKKYSGIHGCCGCCFTKNELVLDITDFGDSESFIILAIRETKPLFVIEVIPVASSEKQPSGWVVAHKAAVKLTGIIKREGQYYPQRWQAIERAKELVEEIKHLYY